MAVWLWIYNLFVMSAECLLLLLLFFFLSIQRKPRLVPNPVPTSPISSTPEPDTSTVPQDNATIPNSALQAPTGINPPTLTPHNHFDNSFEKENMMVGMSCRCSLRLPEQVREGGAPFRPEAYPAAPRPFWTGPSLLRAAAVRPGLCGLRPQPEHRLFLS